MNTTVRNKRDLMQDLWNQGSFDDVISWIAANSAFIYRNGRRNGWTSLDNENFFSIRITHLDLRWDEQVSNSHSCPRGGVTNWGGRDVYTDGTPKPRGYPGWQGRIEYVMSHDIGFGSDAMEGTGIHTGTGGGIGGNRFGYEARLFESDWPRISESTVLGRLIEDNAWRRYTYGEPLYFR